ncbi:MAG TPA: hypothetical protein VMV69_09675, partial [Pirellulales bacterium]|nr:hypothetical protein [Pirellulales bacterium]
MVTVIAPGQGPVFDKKTTIRLIAGFLGLASIQGSSDNPFPQFGKEAGMSRLPMDRSRVREV